MLPLNRLSTSPLQGQGNRPAKRLRLRSPGPTLRSALVKHLVAPMTLPRSSRAILPSCIADSQAETRAHWGMGRDMVTPLWVFVVWYVWGGICGRSYSPWWDRREGRRPLRTLIVRKRSRMVGMNSMRPGRRESTWASWTWSRHLRSLAKSPCGPGPGRRRESGAISIPRPEDALETCWRADMDGHMRAKG
jgi:hypothetical protein